MKLSLRHIFGLILVTCAALSGWHSASGADISGKFAIAAGACLALIMLFWVVKTKDQIKRLTVISAIGILGFVLWAWALIDVPEPKPTTEHLIHPMMFLCAFLYLFSYLDSDSRHRLAFFVLLLFGLIALLCVSASY